MPPYCGTMSSPWDSLFQTDTILYIMANHIQSFYFFWEGTVSNLAIWLVPNPVRQVEYVRHSFHFHFHLFHTIPRGLLLMRASFVMLLTTRSDARARKGVRRSYHKQKSATSPFRALASDRVVNNITKLARMSRNPRGIVWNKWNKWNMSDCQTINVTGIFHWQSDIFHLSWNYHLYVFRYDWDQLNVLSMRSLILIFLSYEVCYCYIYSSIAAYVTLIKIQA